jgi:aminoglycoside phosphotransferase (APT) family kinase protein
MAETDGPLGIDVPRVSVWLEASIEGAKGPFCFELVAGGRSNLTYKVTGADGSAYALRRPPVSHVLPTAHDMVREHTIISALGGAGIPVPEALGLCTDVEVNERPFYVMSFVDGHILRTEEMAIEALTLERRAAVGPNLATCLAELHAVDVDAVGLGSLAKREAYVARQLKRWRAQYEQMVGADESHGELVRSVGDRLAASIPVQQAATIVHGDYRLDNCVLDDLGQVKAILDWELCTLGDPMADLGMLLVYWAEPGDATQALIGQSPTMAPGFSGRAELLGAYAAHSDLDLSELGYYQAFANWRIGCILQGVYRRYQEGAGAGDTTSVASFPAHIAALAQAASDQLSELCR